MVAISPIPTVKQKKKMKGSYLDIAKMWEDRHCTPQFLFYGSFFYIKHKTC